MHGTQRGSLWAELISLNSCPLYCVESCLCKTHVSPEPQTITSCGNRSFAGVLSLGEVELD